MQSLKFIKIYILINGEVKIDLFDFFRVKLETRPGPPVELENIIRSADPGSIIYLPIPENSYNNLR